jgi:hypothetical protein
VFAFKDCSETILLMQRAGELVEIKTFTGKKTLMNAVALVLHTYLYGAGGIYLCVLQCSTVWGEVVRKRV